MAAEPFEVSITEAEIADLRERLRRTRWPEPEPVDDWSQGLPLAYAQELCRSWTEDYDFSQVDALGAGAGHAADGRVGPDPPEQAQLRQLAEEQAALRRVATLVARGEPPEAVFAAVLEEVGRLLPIDLALMGRYEPDRTATCVATWPTGGDIFPVGSRWPLKGHNLITLVFETGRPARIDRYADSASGPIGAAHRGAGTRSAVGAPVIVEGCLWGMIYAGSTLQPPLPPDTEARLISFTELVATAIANAQSRAELIASRARIVAAADEARRRIQRDLHDGTQQQLVSLMLDLRQVQAAAPPELEGGLSRIADRVTDVFDQVREISHGIHPAILSERGLTSALKALARRSAVPVELDLRTRRRLPDQVEVTAYYAISEALANAAKHARASVVHVELDTPDTVVRLAIRDDGIGGADAAQGSGLVGLRDRIEAAGGTFDVTSPAGHGTTLLIEIPCPAGLRRPGTGPGRTSRTGAGTRRGR